ncbi:MAG: hypothetical protein QXY40_07385 [Candidatus Methanomethylicia archaeon]
MVKVVRSVSENSIYYSFMMLTYFHSCSSRMASNILNFITTGVVHLYYVLL